MYREAKMTYIDMEFDMREGSFAYLTVRKKANGILASMKSIQQRLEGDLYILDDIYGTVCVTSAVSMANLSQIHQFLFSQINSSDADSYRTETE